MKQIMHVTSRKVQKYTPVTPGKMVNVFLKNNISEKVLSNFTIQSVAKTTIPDVVLLVLTKAEATLLMEWNVESGDVKLNYVNGLVQREEFLRMDVVKFRDSFSVRRDLTFLEQVNEAVKEPLIPGSKLSSPSANYVVEYVTSDNSVVLQSTRTGSDKNKVYPTKTVLIGAKNQDFWRAVNEKIEMVEV